MDIETTRKTWLPTRIGVQNTRYQILGVSRDRLVLRKLISILSYPLVNGLDLFGLERRFANDEGVSAGILSYSRREDPQSLQYHPYRPDVDLERMAIDGIKQYLGSDIVGSSTYGPTSWISI